MPHSVHSTPRESTPVAPPPPASDLSTKWWNAQAPPDQWTSECPAFLLGESEKNQRILASRDDRHPRYDWPKCQELIRTNEIDQFRRSARDLYRYIQYTQHLKQHYGSVLSYIQTHRLQWDSIAPSGSTPFADPADYRVLFNDWPYWVDADIQHLVVWTRFGIDEDERTGEVVEPSKALVERFVEETFCGDGGVPAEHVAWFKNWRSLKSVHALEHFHVMIYRAPEGLLEKVTGGDRPVCESWGR